MTGAGFRLLFCAIGKCGKWIYAEPVFWFWLYLYDTGIFSTGVSSEIYVGLSPQFFLLSCVVK